MTTSHTYDGIDFKIKSSKTGFSVIAPVKKNIYSQFVDGVKFDTENEAIQAAKSLIYNHYQAMPYA